MVKIVDNIEKANAVTHCGTMHADEIFATVIEKLYSNQPNANRKFVTHKNLNQAVYCARSGKAISDHCTLIDIGYYANPDKLAKCDMCK